MKTVYIREFGGPENLEIRSVPMPDPPGLGEIMIRVTAAGLNRADLLQRRGLYPPPPGYDPRRPGLEFSGLVWAVGEGVTEFRKNEAVCGITAGEAQSEYITVDRRLLAHNQNIDAGAMAAVPEAFVTAHDALVTQAGVGRGETVLIHAIASGVGLAAAQIAQTNGATVIGTTRSAEKAAALQSETHDLRRWINHVLVTADGPEFAEQALELTDGLGADVIIDLVGGPYFSENLRCIAAKGRIMLVGLTGGRKTEFDLGAALAKRVTIRGTVLRSRSIEEKAAAMEEFRRDIVPHIAMAGEPYKPIVDRFFGLDEIREAHRYMEADKNIGKVVLKI
jgi:NADPH:quinone reductase